MHYSVLIVDDEAELTEYTAKYFNMSGVTASYAFDVEGALDFFKENTCSLILLDINLGGDSGFELCQEIRKNMDIPIFFISARTSEDDMLLGLSIGGDDYICRQDARCFRERIAVDVFAIFTAFEFEFVARP